MPELEVDDPAKYLRFSVAPGDFQSMVINNGQYEFIEPTKRIKPFMLFIRN
jgi:hypothetical protein